MSTRANYSFIKNNKTLVTFYIHHDGYPEGAANYFQKALLLSNGRIDSPDTFTRANTEAKICYNLMGDIEYHYIFNIDTQVIKIEKIYYPDEESRFKRFITVSQTDIYTFINKYYKVFSSTETLQEYTRKFTWKKEKEIEQRILQENTWIDIYIQGQFNKEKKPRCLALIYQDLNNITKELVDNTLNYGLDNPNYADLILKQQDLIKQLETLVTKVKEEK